MDKFRKYLNEQDEEGGVNRENPDRKTMKLVQKVSQHIDFRGDYAAHFIFLLLEDINFHTEAKYIFDYMMKNMGR